MTVSDPSTNRITRLKLNTSVDPGAATGPVTATFDMTGGDAPPASTVDQTTITSAAPQYGVDSFDGQVTSDAAGVARIDEQSVQLMQKVVARRPVHCPRTRQAFAPGEDLLRDDEDRAASGTTDATRRVGRQILEHVEVLRRIEQTVRMIDAHAGHAALAQERRQEPVDGGEHVRILDAQPGERVHVEEAAVVDFVRGRAPVRQPVRLLFEHGVQCVERVRLAGHAVERREDSFAFLGRLIRDPRERRNS